MAPVFCLCHSALTRRIVMVVQRRHPSLHAGTLALGMHASASVHQILKILHLWRTSCCLSCRYAGKVKGEAGIQACECFTQEEGPFAHFGYMGRNINTFFKVTQGDRLSFP
jgi:hypothetical protein